MSINYAILGILSCQPLTGYDLKKIIQDSSFMYWSANNNQIYKSLVQLLEDGFVTYEVQHQEDAPSKKIYTITEEGLAELKEWVSSTPEAPELKKTFLIQLAWADLLNSEELNALLSKYENEVRMQILLEQEKKRRASFSPDRTPREACIWDMIHENIISSYKNELSWLQTLRQDIGINEREAEKMNYHIVEAKNKKYMECTNAEKKLQTEQDALDLIAAGMENDTGRLMLHEAALSPDFFNLKTGLAGAVLQKFMNYRMKTAAVVTDGQKIKGRFKELLVETNKGKDFRVFTNKAEAEDWLLN